MTNTREMAENLIKGCNGHWSTGPHCFPLTPKQQYDLATAHLALLDEVERLRHLAENERLTKELDQAIQDGTAMDDCQKSMFARALTAECERDAWKANALECGKVLQSFTPGGSEYSGKRIGETYTVDAKACGGIIRHKMGCLHQARRDVVLRTRERDEARAALEPFAKAYDRHTKLIMSGRSGLSVGDYVAYEYYHRAHVVLSGEGGK